MCRYLTLSLFLAAALCFSWPAAQDYKAGWGQFLPCMTIGCQAADDTVLWLNGVGCGLVRFSTVSKTTRIYSNCNSALPSNVISAIAVDRSHTVWLGTYRGLAALSGDQWRVFTKDNAPFPENQVSAVSCAPDGSVWAGFASGGVLSYNGGSWHSILDERPGYPMSVATSNIRKIVALSGTSAWIFASPNYFSFSDALTLVDSSGWHSLGCNIAVSGDVDKNGVLWACGGDEFNYSLFSLAYPSGFHEYPVSVTGALRYSTETMIGIDPQNRKWVTASGLKHLVCFNDTAWKTVLVVKDTTDHSTIASMAFDNTARPWLALNTYDYTYNANAYIRHARVAALSAAGAWEGFPVNAADVPTSYVLSLLQTRNNGLWVFSSNLAAQYVNGAWRHFPDIEDRMYTLVATADSGGGIWLSGAGNGVQCNRNVNGAWRPVMVNGLWPSGWGPQLYLTDQKGCLWASLDSEYVKHGLVAFDTGLVLKARCVTLPRRVAAMCSQPNGSLWATMDSSGILHCNYDNVVEYFKEENSGLPSNIVNGIACGRDGAVWVGTTDSGLVRLSSGVWTAFNKRTCGLPWKWVKPMYVDNTGSVWASVMEDTAYCYWQRTSTGGIKKVCTTSPQYAGLLRFNANGSWVLNTPQNSGLPGEKVDYMVPGTGDTVWVYGDCGTAFFRTGQLTATYDNNGSRIEAGAPRASVTGMRVRAGAAELTLVAPATVSLSLFNVAGRKLYSAENVRCRIGNTVVPLPRIARGVYVVRAKVYVKDIDSFHQRTLLVP